MSTHPSFESRTRAPTPQEKAAIKMEGRSYNVLQRPGSTRFPIKKAFEKRGMTASVFKKTL